ncbi:hypothetical protein CDIK_0224 [Cucumispora dikerogammari]|nr:hypothetical protein CDIK_0224 [Cucumispora dikerogammari]
MIKPVPTASVVNIFVCNPSLIACRNTLSHACIDDTLYLQAPKSIEDYSKPCEDQLKCLLSFINCTYWNGKMPCEVKKAVLLIHSLVPNKQLFILLISNVIHQTSGLKILDSAVYKETSVYQSKGIIQLKGKNYYKMASLKGKTNFVKNPQLMATLCNDAIVGSVYVWLSIAKQQMKCGGLCFLESVQMMKPNESYDFQTPCAVEKWKDRFNIYKKVCCCFGVSPWICPKASKCPMGSCGQIEVCNEEPSCDKDWMLKEFESIFSNN